MRYRLAYLLALIVCLCAMSSCADPIFGIGGAPSAPAAPHATSPLSGTSWNLTQLRSGGTTWTLVPTVLVTIQFQRDDSSYIGSSGCNFYSGGFATSDNRLNLKFKSITQKACVGPIMSQEVAYLNAMQQVRDYQISGQTLTMRDNENRIVLVFTAATVPVAPGGATSPLREHSYCSAGGLTRKT
jgi:heat shock protein HslJ